MAQAAWVLSLPSGPQSPLTVSLQEGALGVHMQAQGRAGGKPSFSSAQASPACSLVGSQPLHLGLGPQTCKHGNSRSAS